MNQLEYKYFSENIYDKTFAQKVPSHGQFELTFRCALKCGFCYCSCYTSQEYTQNELSTKEVIKILNEAADGGCLWMTFSGGDPFIRTDFKEIYDHAIQLGMILNIFCSGLIITDEWITHLQNFPPLRIEFPFYGVTKSIYEKVAGKKNTFDRAMENIYKLHAAKLPMKLKTKITKDNIHELPLIKKFIEEDLGLTFSPNYYLYPKLDGSREHLEKRLSASEIYTLSKEFEFDACDSSSEAQEADIENPKLFRCAAGINSFYINPYGELNFCTYVREKSFDLKNGELAKGIAFLRESLLKKSYPASSPCKSCSIQTSCQNCPGHAVLETGALDGKSEYLCETNHTIRGKEWLTK